MASSTFFIPSVNVIGADSLTDAMNMMADYGFTRTLIVTDNMLTKLGMAGDVQKALEERNIFSVIYDGTQPNPTTENVAAGLKLLKENNCDSVISLGGGSPHDCAKGIALVAANGGDIRDYEGVDRSAKPQLPMIAINTTAGTASEMTRFCIITDEARHIKMAIVDKHVTPLLSVNDSSLIGFAPIFPDTCYHLTHYWPAAADIPVASDNPVHYADAIRYNARTPLQGSLLPLTRLV